MALGGETGERSWGVHAVRNCVSMGPAYGFSDSVLLPQGCSESGHHHDGSPEEDLEQHPGHALPAAEHKRPQEAPLITSSADPHHTFLNTYFGTGAAGGVNEKGAPDHDLELLQHLFDFGLRWKYGFPSTLTILLPPSPI